ncbi:MAG: PD40 domain-containing protein [Armatimonadota bacterium]|nr:MAG: PD40 domain-containing protein [Armatimonadota bacterium]
MRGQTCNSERVFRTDPRGGVTVVQLTSYPRGSWNMYFEHNHFTPDCGTVIISRQRELRPGAPADIYRVDVDGTNMTQLTDDDGIYGIALSRDGRHVYYMHGTTLKRVAMDSFALDEVLHVEAEGAQPGGVGCAGQTGDGRYLFCTMRVGEETGLFRLAVDGSGAELLCAAPRLNHVSCDPGHDVVSFGGTIKGKHRLWVINADGGEPREFPMQRFAHCAWLGKTGRMQGCLLPPGRAIMSIAEGDPRPEPIVAGPYFWHSGASLDGEWIVADTNWPDEGLMLVHVPTRSFSFLCDAGAADGDSWGGHPEPAISPDGRFVIYTSNRTGIPQVYLAHVPDEMREALRLSLEWQGEPCVAGKHYMPRHGWVCV